MDSLTLNRGEEYCPKRLVPKYKQQQISKGQIAKHLSELLPLGNYSWCTLYDYNFIEYLYVFLIKFIFSVCKFSLTHLFVNIEYKSLVFYSRITQCDTPDVTTFGWHFCSTKPKNANLVNFQGIDNHSVAVNFMYLHSYAHTETSTKTKIYTSKSIKKKIGTIRQPSGKERFVFPFKFCVSSYVCYV